MDPFMEVSVPYYYPRAHASLGRPRACPHSTSARGARNPPISLYTLYLYPYGIQLVLLEHGYPYLTLQRASRICKSRAPVTGDFGGLNRKVEGSKKSARGRHMLTKALPGKIRRVKRREEVI